ncbi:MAG: hypothetical protein ACK4E3_05870 [Brevundimonas sp.]|uniref:hypothetical protein n=1 Tax=Brevundimonas sp. TaxID=1871086 RepID=UPI003918ADC4
MSSHLSGFMSRATSLAAALAVAASLGGAAWHPGGHDHHAQAMNEAARCVAAYTFSAGAVWGDGESSDAPQTEENLARADRNQAAATRISAAMSDHQPAFGRSVGAAMAELGRHDYTHWFEVADACDESLAHHGH